MGYCVEMTLRDVKFKKSHTKAMIKVLRKLNNELLIPNNSWCRFHPDCDDLEEIFDNMSFSLNEDETYGYIEDFIGEKLGHHEEVLRALAPYLEDCEIKFLGEDDTAWKFKIVNGKALDSVYREEF